MPSGRNPGDPVPGRPPASGTPAAGRPPAKGTPPAKGATPAKGTPPAKGAQVPGWPRGVPPDARLVQGGPAAERPQGQGGGPAAERPRVQVAPLTDSVAGVTAGNNGNGETSRSSQTIMLGLGALLLAVAAITFVGVTISGLQPWGQLVILLVAAGLFLAGPIPAITRGLVATAETLAAVGLLVLAVAGYPLWATGAVAALPGATYGGLVAATTAAAGYGYQRLSRLTGPRYLALLALQPVLPLLAAPWVRGAAAWALVFTLVGAMNVALARAGGARTGLGLVAAALYAVAALVAVGFAAAGLVAAGNPAAGFPAAALLVLAAVPAVPAARGLGGARVFEIAAALVTLAAIAAAVRLVVLALPDRALLPVAAIVTAAMLIVTQLPEGVRRGPVRAGALALTALGVLVAGLSLRAGYAALVWPPWPEGLPDYPARLAEAVGPAGWQLATAAAAATIGAGFSLPRAYRREVTAAGAGLSALAAPASFGLAPTAGAWVLVVVAAGLAVTGLGAPTRRAAVSHLAAAGVTGLAAAGVGLAAPVLTATILAALTVTGAVVGGAWPRGKPADPDGDPGAGPGETPPVREEPAPAELVAGWGAGTATLTLPGAAATGAAAAGLATPMVLAAGFVALCGSLSYATLAQLRQRPVPLPARAGTALATVAVASTAFTTDPSLVDAGLGALLIITAVVVVVAAPQRATRLDAGWWLAGPDLAAAATTVSVVATLARAASLVLPFTGADAALTTAALLVLAVALGVRALPGSWQRGPVLGMTLVGGLVAGFAAVAAVAVGFRTLLALSPLWEADLGRWPPSVAVAGVGWSAALVPALLAVAAAVALPRPAGAGVTGALAAFAAVAAPVVLGLPWWGPAAVAAAVAAGLALAAATGDPRAATARFAVAVLLGLYGLGTALARPGVTAGYLAVVVLVGAGAAVAAGRRPADDPRRRVGGLAITAALLAGPGLLASATAALGHPRGIGLLAALAGTSLGLAVLALLPLRGGTRQLGYLGYGTVGVAAGATATAFATLPTTHPTGVYAAAAVLLAVLAELVRAAARAGTRTVLAVPPGIGAVLAATVPAAMALTAIAPALRAALVDPYQTITAFWQGPPPELLDARQVLPSSVLTALLLTLAAAVAAVGFGGAATRQTVPLVAPALAITMLIAPAALGAPWPVGTVAALAVFTIAMLGVALTPPPEKTRLHLPLRAARGIGLVIGLVAGGAGLAGSFADPLLTWATLGGAVAVGATAAVGGRTTTARLLGWLGAAASANLFALTSGVLLGLGRPQQGFPLLVVAAVALLVIAPRQWLARTDRRERAAVEWVGGYGALAGALALGFASAPDLAALLIGVGAVLGVASFRRGRSAKQRRTLWWSGMGSELLAWWIMMRILDIGLVEAYTLPFAALALVVGAREARLQGADLSTWVSYTPGLVAAFGPSLLLLLIASGPDPVRQGWVLLGGVGTLWFGSKVGHKAPLVIGAVVTAAGALHLLGQAGPWLILIALGLLLLILGASRERRRRRVLQIRGAYSRMR